MCKAPKLEKLRLAQVYEMHFGAYLKSNSRKLKIKDKHIKAVRMAEKCRTKALGICDFVCLDCGEVKEILRSCKHRFCAKCGAASTFKWAEDSLTRLMNIKHHHIVMTLPKAFRLLSKMNGDILHNELFKLSAKVIQDFFQNKYNIRIGIVSVLHTSGSDLKYHPHVHMIVSRGGQDLTNGQYRQIKGEYLCEQRFLGNKLRELFHNRIKTLYKKGIIKVYKAINNQTSLSKWLDKQNLKHWIVSIQKPLNDIEQIVGYVGRYTKRACISEYKLEHINNDKIVFRFNDYKNTPRGHKPIESKKQMNSVEFLDKLLQHVPNKRYRMVRYYGLYNSFYLKKIPNYIKKNYHELEADLELSYQWGEYEELRKAFLRAGKNDPLYCYNCKQDRVLYQIRFNEKIITIYDDSS